MCQIPTRCSRLSWNQLVLFLEDVSDHENAVLIAVLIPSFLKTHGNYLLNIYMIQTIDPCLFVTVVHFGQFCFALSHLTCKVDDLKKNEAGICPYFLMKASISPVGLYLYGLKSIFIAVQVSLVFVKQFSKTIILKTIAIFVHVPY